MTLNGDSLLAVFFYQVPWSPLPSRATFELAHPTSHSKWLVNDPSLYGSSARYTWLRRSDSAEQRKRRLLNNPFGFTWIKNKKPRAPEEHGEWVTSHSCRNADRKQARNKRKSRKTSQSRNTTPTNTIARNLRFQCHGHIKKTEQAHSHQFELILRYRRL